MRTTDVTRLMGGEIQVFRYDTRPGWYVRFWNKEKRRYVVRSLKTEDASLATDRAIQIWKEIVPLIQAGVPTETLTLQAAVHQYLNHKEARVEAGEIKPGAHRDAVTQLKTFLIFCKLEDIQRISDVQPHSFDGFVEWRRDKSLKVTTGKEGRLKRTSLNKSIREVRAFWKYLRKKRLTDVDLDLMEQPIRHEEERTRNVAFTPEHWALIEAQLVADAKEIQGEHRELLPSQRYFRVMFKTLLQVLCDSGMRPQEAVNLLAWRDVKLHEQGKSPTEKALSGACSLQIRNPTGKGSRITVCDSGVYLKLWRRYVIQWRKDNGHAPLQPNDLVFGNPMKGEPYVYSYFGNHFRDLLARLELTGLGYTIRSSRGFCVTRLLAMGHPAYLVAKNLGHSQEVMRKSYEQLTEADLLAQFAAD